MEPILAAMKMVRELYDKLSLEELLLLIYDTYPEYQKKSDVFEVIRKAKKKLAENLVKKGFIDEERYEDLIAGN
jgi:membrane carboxypeptidase/penicillin-binding protein PbpC